MFLFFTFISTIGMLQDLSDGRIFTFCNYYQGSASSSGDIPYQCRANPPNPLFLSDRCITIRIGTPHHTSPPAAKSAFPINTRPSTATVALYFTTVFIQSSCQWSNIIRETHFEFILENHQYHFRRQENIMRWRKMGNCDFADLRVFDWVRQQGGDPVATFQAGQINHNFLLSKMIVMMVETLITVTDFRIFFLRSSLKKH